MGLLDFDELLFGGGCDGGRGLGAVDRLGALLDTAPTQTAVLLQAGRRAGPVQIVFVFCLFFTKENVLQV